MSKVIHLYRNEGEEMEKQINNNLLQLSKLIIFFANKSKINLYKTKLNKLLFYAQFLYYKTYGERLLGDEFIKDYYGPVLEDIDRSLMFLSDSRIIDLSENKYGLIIEACFELNEEAYSSAEEEILNKVNKKFEKYTAADISEYSHQESLWINTELKEKIEITRAKELNEFFV